MGGRITDIEDIMLVLGHWDKPEDAHGDKRNPEDFDRFRGLAKIGTQMERHILPEQATLNQIYSQSRWPSGVDESSR